MKRRDFVTLLGASLCGLTRNAVAEADLLAQSIYQDQGEVTSLALSADNRILAVAVVSDVGLWDIRESRHLRWIRTNSSSVREFGKDTYAVRGMAFNPDGSRLATTGGMGTIPGIKIWDTDSGKLHRHIVEPWRMREPGSGALQFGPVAFSADGSKIVAGLANGAVHVWSAEDGALLQSYGESAATSVSVPLDELVAGMDQASQEECVRSLRGTDNQGNATAIPTHVMVFAMPHPQFVQRVGFGAGDSVVVAALHDRVVAWDTESAMERFSWPDATAFAVAPHGNSLAVMSKRGEIEVVDCESEARKTLPHGSGLERGYEFAFIGEEALACVGRHLAGDLIYRTLDLNSGVFEDRALPWARVARVGAAVLSSDGLDVAVTGFNGAEIIRMVPRQVP